MPLPNAAEQYSFYNFFSWFTITILAIIAVLIATSAASLPEQKEYELTEKQMIKIVNQIELKGYRNLMRIKCEGKIAEFIQTGKWSDYYCASLYGHLDLK